MSRCVFSQRLEVRAKRPTINHQNAEDSRIRIGYPPDSVRRFGGQCQCVQFPHSTRSSGPERDRRPQLLLAPRFMAGENFLFDDHSRPCERRHFLRRLIFGVRKRVSRSSVFDFAGLCRGIVFGGASRLGICTIGQDVQYLSDGRRDKLYLPRILI